MLNPPPLVLCALVATPLLLFPSPARLLAVAVVTLVVVHKVYGKSICWPTTAADGPIFGLLVALVVSSLTSPTSDRLVEKVASLLAGLWWFYAVVDWQAVHRDRRGVMELMTFGTIGLVALALVGTDWRVKFRAIQLVTDLLPRLVAGVPGAPTGWHPNAVAGALVLLIPIQVARVVNAWSPVLSSVTQIRSLIIPLVAAVAGLLVLVLTQSRGGLVSLGVTGMLVLMAVARPWMRAVLALGTVAGAAAVVGRPDQWWTLMGPAFLENAQGRIEVWQRALTAIGEAPVTGFGLGAFRRVMPTWYPTALGDPLEDTAHAHNLFLQTALDVGIPGLICMMAIWLVGAVAIRKRITTQPELRQESLGLAAGLLAYGLFNLTDAIPLGSKLSVLHWIVLALCLGPSADAAARKTIAHRSMAI